MSKGRCLGALLALIPVLCLADVSMPDTPAGHAFSAWLDAINSADRARQETFLKAYPSWMNVDELADWSAGTGGYELLEVHPTSPTNVFFHLKQRRWDVEEFGRMQVNATTPVSLEVLDVRRIPPGATFAPLTLDKAARERVVARVADAFDTSYLDPPIGKKMASALRKHAARGNYRTLAYGDALARELTRELQEISQDKHVEVRFSYFVQPPQSPAKQLEVESQRMAAINCGFDKVEHLPPNIGYVKFDMFADPAICAPTANAAMTFVADSDSLILDLRDNHGGNPDMGLLILSYLVEARTHVADTFNRAATLPIETWTLPSVPGKKFAGKRILVLTSRGTFSAGEAVAYYLQALKRATVVGETTGGGGHLTQTKPIDEHFSVRLPYARSVSPITHAGWEGTGVAPDVKVAGADALDAALKLAAE